MGNFTFLDKNWPELAKMGNLAEHIVKYMLAYDGIAPLEILPQNVFNVSCVPWLHFEHFSSNTSNGDNKIIKMITLGKYAEINGRFLLPLTIQVSHAIVDGYHISLFFNRLQEELNIAEV